MEELYYAHPVQVRYWNTYQERYVGAIAYQDYLICGITGRKIALTEIIEQASFKDISQDSAIIELDWVPIDEAILGM